MLAKVIGEFNPGWDSTESYDDCFWKAEAMAGGVLRNLLNLWKEQRRGVHLSKKQGTVRWQDFDSAKVCPMEERSDRKQLSFYNLSV